MLRDIVRKEIMDNISTFKFVVIFVVVTVLIISGLVLGSRNYLDLKGDAEEQLELNRKMLASQSNWINAGYIGTFETKKPYVLSIVDSGVDNSLGRQANVNIDAKPVLDESRNLVAPIMAVFGEVDLTFVVEIILSLFVILLTYDAVSGEKERGTLKLALANDVPRYKLILGKMIGGFSVIAVSFLLPLLIGIAFMQGFYSSVMADFTPDSWIRFSLVILAYLFYLSVFFAVGLFVSSICHRSSTSFIILLMVWVLFVTIIPRVSLTAAENVRPYKSYATLQLEAFSEVSQKRKEIMQKWMTDRKAWAKAISEGTFADRFTELFSSFSEAQKKAMEDRDTEFLNQQNSQISLAETISRSVSPASALNFAVQNLAGTGWERQREYVRQLAGNQQKFKDMVFGKMSSVKGKNIQEVIQKMFMNESLDVDSSEIRFDFREETLSEVVVRTFWDFGVLVILSLLFFAAAFVFFIRYDVR
jgi:ABC-type transport system involved in multi-copper enzyme maturation permease subunit